MRRGTTVATNALLERRGVPTLFVANRGLGDVLAIGARDLTMVVAVGAGTLACLGWLWNDLLSITVSEELAAVEGSARRAASQASYCRRLFVFPVDAIALEERDTVFSVNVTGEIPNPQIRFPVVNRLPAVSEAVGGQVVRVG